MMACASFLVGSLFDFDIRIIFPLGDICSSFNFLDKFKKDWYSFFWCLNLSLGYCNFNCLSHLINQPSFIFFLLDNRKIRVNGTKEPIEFKSNQWFGATVRAHKGKVVVSIDGLGSCLSCASHGFMLDLLTFLEGCAGRRTSCLKNRGV